MNDTGIESGQAEALRLFEHKLKPLLDLMTETSGAEEVFVDGDQAWLVADGGPVALDWAALAPVTPGLVRGAMRNAAVFGAREFGARPPATPTLTVKMPPRWRVSAVMPPAADEWHVAIRHLKARALSLDDYVTAGVMDHGQGELLKAMLDGGDNILVSGGTAAGKTTLLGAMLRWAARHERTLVIEDTPELAIDGRNVVQLRTCPGEDLASLLRQVLRMTPQRIVLGEVRGPEALELVTAANTGHRGTLATLHSNGREKALTRLHTQVRKLQPSYPFEEIQDAIDAVVQIEVRHGRRQVTDIWRVPKG